ncbi:MAG: hypothetical protein QOE86_1722 [Solirubrobacteraceae bacterium]|jgi:hypothetical protein|nr:hypothetical protein [Solirubrobacteraceae bacterium]
MAMPKQPPGTTREAVRRLLETGLRPAQVAEELGIARPTVAYHARRLGIDPRAGGRRYDWAQIRAYYEAGHTYVQCRDRFGFCGASWTAAIRRGAIVPRPPGMPIDALLVGPRNRKHIRMRLISGGHKEARCEACGLDEWRGEPMPLQLHHVNGDGEDNRLENLQILCPNCHALTDTWGGRNKRRVVA